MSNSDEKVVVHLTSEQWKQILRIEHASKQPLRAQILKVVRESNGDRQKVIAYLRSKGIKGDIA